MVGGRVISWEGKTERWKGKRKTGGGNLKLRAIPKWKQDPLDENSLKAGKLARKTNKTTPATNAGKNGQKKNRITPPKPTKAAREG